MAFNEQSRNKRTNKEGGKNTYRPPKVGFSATHYAMRSLTHPFTVGKAAKQTTATPMAINHSFR